jgi:hypothetical protein
MAFFSLFPNLNLTKKKNNVYFYNSNIFSPECLLFNAIEMALSRTALLPFTLQTMPENCL